MTNHVHLLVTPCKKAAVSKMMQSLGRKYVQYFNFKYSRSGTLWEGRFRSCLVESGRYVLACYRYIELNPVRAGMVSNPKDYRWSSYAINATGLASKLCTAHPSYLGLSESVSERLDKYRGLFASELQNEGVEDIRLSTQKGLILGTQAFKDQTAELLGRRVEHQP